MIIMSMGWDYVSKLRRATGILFIPQAIYQHRVPWWNDIGRENSWFVHQSYLAILPVESSSRKWRRCLAKEMMNLALRSIFIHASKWFFTFRKVLRHGADVCISPPKESVLRIFVALKNPSPLPGLKPRTLGPMATTLTITSPMRQKLSYLSPNGIKTGFCVKVWFALDPLRAWNIRLCFLR
jgi:hypothetical protein